MAWPLTGPVSSTYKQLVLHFHEVYTQEMRLKTARSNRLGASLQLVKPDIQPGRRGARTWPTPGDLVLRLRKEPRTTNTRPTRPTTPNPPMSTDEEQTTIGDVKPCLVVGLGGVNSSTTVYMIGFSPLLDEFGSPNSPGETAKLESARRLAKLIVEESQIHGDLRSQETAHPS